LSRPRSARCVIDEALLERIRAIHRESRGTYGAPRIHAELVDEGWRIGRKRVARLMREAGLFGVSRRKWISTTQRRPDARPAPDLVARDFTADRPDQLYVAGWAMANHLCTEIVLDALNMALHQRQPSNVIHHSDQGTQYSSISFGRRCKQAGVRPSMGSVGDCYDNAMCESFFATLECELIDRTTFRTHAEAKLAIFEFIEGWYNPHRRHSSIDYLSPINYERRMIATTEISTH
jgi:putative transposase